jgi:hypothetical protein
MEGEGVSMRMLLKLWVVLLIPCGLPGATEESPKKSPAPPDPLQKWIEQLNSEKAGDRAAAARQLGEYLRGPQTFEAGFSDLPRPDKDPSPPEVGATRLAHLADALRIASADKDAALREQSAIALGSIKSKTPEVEAALRAGIESGDRKVRWYCVQSIQRLRPDAKQFVPVLSKRMTEDAGDAWFYAWAIADYGEEARFVAPELAKLLSHAEKKMRQWAAIALRDVGVDAETAKQLVDGTIKSNETEAADVFIALFSQPREAVRFAEAHPKMGDELQQRIRFVYRALCKTGGDAELLREAIRKLTPPPPLIMGLLQDEKFLPALDEQMKTADPHTRTLLEACSRACGRAPQRIVKLSKEQQGDFRPASALPGVDNKRQSKEMKGHGDGLTRVLITGTLRMEDGKPARAPQFFAASDRMLLGLAEDEPESLLYDSKSGRFVFLTSVFAAYDMGEGAAEPGPYQTGSALTRIEAEGAQPLEVRFFDEMPHVEITLQAGDGRPQTRPTIKSRKTGVIGGVMPPPSRD